jgi:hypothetical protein
MVNNKVVFLFTMEHWYCHELGCFLTLHSINRNGTLSHYAVADSIFLHSNLGLDSQTGYTSWHEIATVCFGHLVLGGLTRCIGRDYHSDVAEGHLHEHNATRSKVKE